MSQPENYRPGEVEARYQELALEREPFLMRARECAALTIPDLLPRHDDVASHKLPTPYQSIGALGVENLSAKLLLGLFPPNGQFFRLTLSSFELDQMVMAKAAENGYGNGPEALENAVREREEVENDVQELLGRHERAVVQHYATKGNRATDSEILKHLIVSGNALRRCALKKRDRPRMYGLNKYVTKRAPDGEVLEIIVKEGVSPRTLPKKIKDACEIPEEENGDKNLFQNYDLYTRVIQTVNKRGARVWEEYQELNGNIVPGSYGTYKIDKCPWLALRWRKIDGEDYGRGRVESCLGDLISLNGLKKALVDGSIGMARLLFLVKAAATTRPRDVAQAVNGQVITGDANDITTMKVDKAGDFSVAERAAIEIGRSLGQAFLMTTSIQRNAERVTAEEFRRLANELESGLGGTFSVLAEEYQLPLTEMLIYSMEKQRILPPLPDEVTPTILTGLQALGRSADLERELMFYDALSRVPVPQEEAMYALDAIGAYRRIAAHLGIETRGLLRSPDQIQQMKDAAQQAAMAQMMAPQIAQAAAGAEQEQAPPV